MEVLKYFNELIIKNKFILGTQRRYRGFVKTDGQRLIDIAFNV